VRGGTGGRREGPEEGIFLEKELTVGRIEEPGVNGGKEGLTRGEQLQQYKDKTREKNQPGKESSTYP